MKKYFIICFLFFSFAFADNAKQLTLACNSYEDIINTKNIEQSMRDGAIPKNCLLLTSNAKITVVDDKLEDSRIVKILVIDIDSHMYSLKEDIIITNENKI
ncbi:hypothetical protein [Arcobacter sp. LA11]|uniref:hypothetical protein n=1 Tax=Arcobacter sp. LA11 TaxID=1898176 RepID=UPI0009346D8C|nr:hypothetical protein [Arcobacter sp. LA11]